MSRYRYPGDDKHLSDNVNHACNPYKPLEDLRDDDDDVEGETE